MTNTQLTSNSMGKKLKGQEQDRNVHFHHSWATWYQQQQSNRKKKQRHSNGKEEKTCYLQATYCSIFTIRIKP